MVEQLYEHYNTGDDNNYAIYSSSWGAQTFTIGGIGSNISHNITKVILKLSRKGTPGNLYVTINEVDGGGYPTSTILSSGSIDGNTLTTDFIGGWYEINMPPYTLQESTKYAIIIHQEFGTISHRVNWLYDSTAITYIEGSYFYSSNGGSSWILKSGRDFMFEVWGEPVGEPPTEGNLQIRNITKPETAQFEELVNIIIHTQNIGENDNFKVELTGDITDSSEFSIASGATQDVLFSFTMLNHEMNIMATTYHLE